MLNKNSQIHLIGIGGVSMSGIAEILAERGYKVSGSDLNESKYFDLLRKYEMKKYQHAISLELVLKASH